MAITKFPPAQAVDDEQPSQPLAAAHVELSHQHQHSVSDASTATVDIEAWTVAALDSLSIDPVARGTGGSALSIPLDSASPAQTMRLRGVGVGFDPVGAGVGAGITPPRRPPSRRDSMKKREALQKGKEGSRQRRRWENGKPGLPIIRESRAGSGPGGFFFPG